MRCPAALASIVATFSSIATLAADEPPPANPETAAESFVPEEILDTKVHDLGERRLILQEVIPPPLPAPPPAPAPFDPSDPAAQQRLAAFQARYADSELIAFSATVYDHAHTLLRWWPQDRPAEACTAWVNVDLNHLGGHIVVEHGGRRFRLNLGLGNEDTAKAAAAWARRGGSYQPPAIPEFTGTAPAAIVPGETVPPPTTMDPVEAILDLYRTQGAALKLAYEQKQQAEAEQRAALEANPPPAADVVLRYWRTGGKAVEAPKTDGN